VQSMIGARIKSASWEDGLGADSPRRVKGWI
jgi:hypothetical protein